MKKPIAIKTMETFIRFGPKKADEIQEAELNAIGEEVQAILSRHNPLDYPYIAAVMSQAADCIKASLPDSGKRMVEMLLETTACIAVCVKAGDENGKG